jgi:dCTP deaminase
MSILTGRQIKELVRNNLLIIEPFDESLVEPATYDLRLFYKVLASPVGEKQLGRVIDLRDSPDGCNVLPGQMVGILSYEKIRLPLNISGRFGIRSSLARKGINAFGGIQLDPGFRGRLIMNLINVGPEPIQIRYKDPVFSVEFSKLDEMAEIGYNGPYQDQDDFPADQYNYILSARTTSLAEIPTLRLGLGRLTGLLEEFEERLPDPDEGLSIKPNVEKKLWQSSQRSRDSLLTPSQIKDKLGC